MNETSQSIVESFHDFRKRIDALIQVSEKYIENADGSHNREFLRTMALTRTKLQEAKMWAGKTLEALGSELPAEFRDKHGE